MEVGKLQEILWLMPDDFEIDVDLEKLANTMNEVIFSLKLGVDE